MPDRSSGQDLPEERGRGSHARGRQPQYGAADASRTEPVNSHRGRNGDGYGTGTPETYRPVNGNPFGAPIRGDYGSGQADPLGARTAGTYGTGPAAPFREARGLGRGGGLWRGRGVRPGERRPLRRGRSRLHEDGRAQHGGRDRAEPAGGRTSDGLDPACRAG